MADSKVFEYAKLVATQELQRFLKGDIAGQFAEFYFDSDCRSMLWAAVLSDLLVDSKQDAQAWDICSRIAARFIADASPLPDDLRRWTVRLLQGESTRPTKRGRHSEIVRDVAVIRAIRLVLEQCPDLNATRNESPGHQPNAAGGSVCDAVGLALQQSNIEIAPLSYSSIRSIWQWYLEG